MDVRYVKFQLDERNAVLNHEDASAEIRALHSQIEMLKTALEIEMQTVADLRELLDAVRKIAYDIKEQLLRGKN